jgi:predicted transcriptional regulator
MTTTIKVSDELRDRLKAQAARAGLTIGAHLAVLADAADRRDRLAGMKQAIADSPAEVIDAHLEESRQWETTEWADASLA